jgi:serine/threonine protein kinase
MDPDRWRRIEELYHAALSLKGENRAAFLERACPDPALRAEVQSLLLATSDNDAFLRQLAADLLPAETPDLTGQRFGAFDLVSFIGRGSMGDVYRARDTVRSRDVAVKLLPDRLSAYPDAVARFEREARLLAGLVHPNIAALYGLEILDGRHGLILELVEGQTLHDVIGGRPLAAGEALAIADQIAQALECAHTHDVIHRDLKPANIRLTPAGVVKVLDFGLAKAWRGDASVDLSQISTFATRDGIVLGTPAYMSPEQARGHAVDKRTDLWAFGCILFEMLSGRRPFAGSDMVETVQLIFEREPEWQALPGETPAPLIRLVRRCLRKDPADRVNAIAVLRRDLAKLLNGPPPRSGVFGALSRAAARWKQPE